MKHLLVTLLLTGCCLLMLAQNVGIGTSSPTDPLHVNGGVRLEKLASNPQAPVYVDSNGRLFTNQDQMNVNAYSIPDNSCTGATSVILVSGLSNSINAADIEVKLNILHPYDADLRVYLVAPNLQVLNLARGIGGGGDNFTGTIFTDNAPASIITGNAPFTGRFKPMGDNTPSCGGITPTVSSFAQFGGGTINPNGQWILKVYDSANLDAGTLTDWTISFNGRINGAARTAFNAYSTSSITIPNGITITVPFNAREYDLDNSFNTSTGTFTANSAGVYHFTGTIFWNTGTATDLSTDLYVNGIWRKRFYAESNYGNYYQQRFDTDMYLNASDAVILKLTQNSGFGLQVIGSSIFTNWSGFKVN